MVYKKIKFDYIRLTIYISIFILLGFVANGNINVSCFWQENYGMICPACGITRATKNILYCNISEAMKYNMFYTCILVPFVVFLVINDIYIIIKRNISKKISYSYVDILLGYGEKK